MDEIKNTNTEIKTEKTSEELKQERTDKQEQLRKTLQETREKLKESDEARASGKGKLTLETPIMSSDNEITELAYDFTALTGMEYADAMDLDQTAGQIYRITYRQGIALFAQAAAKQTDGLDMRDIMERIGVTDAVEGVQLATLFFSASTRAGRLRISKM
jgi:hypothetical protein